MGKLEDTYKDIALEYIKTKDIVKSYYKYHPESKVTDSAPYRLLGEVRFQEIKEGIIREAEPDLDNKVNQCLQSLYKLSQSAIKQSDKIVAATNFLKFTMGEKHKNINSEERAVELEAIARRLGLTQ